MAPRVSVALCTCDGARYLPAQLASIAAQSRAPDELVACDDASADASMALLQEFARTAAFPVRLFANPVRLGVAGNFGQAIARCAGDVIALADQDDVWEPAKLAALVRPFRSASVGLAFSDAELVNDRLRPLGARLWSTVGFTAARRRRLTHGDAISVLLEGNVVTGATLAFRSAFRDLILPIPGAWIHDGWIALLVATRARLVPLARPLVRYRQHGAQVVGAGPRGLADEVALARHTGAAAYLAEAARYAFAHRRLARGEDFAAREIVLRQLRGKVWHLRARAAIADDRRRRVPRVIAELATGRYHRYSGGWRSVAKDLVLAPSAVFEE